MNCSDVTLNLQLLVDQELTEDKIQEIRQHLDACSGGCVEKFEAEMLFKQVLRDKICIRHVPGALVEDVRSSVLHHAF
jgi:mycothiol system anti-sigma-R factor